MEELLRDIVCALHDGRLDESALDAVIGRHNRRARGPVRRFAKKDLLPALHRLRDEGAEGLARIGATEDDVRALDAALRLKPRRTASGVATVTVLTEPHPCRGACIFCPNDAQMPKSYLSNEPACQRALRCAFDPYRQVHVRLRALADMGHPCDKVELIVLGGTFSDYPRAYRTRFVCELFRALNDFPGERRDGGCGASLDDAQRENETARCRCVGLSVETRPDCVDEDELVFLRTLGCTKVQIGVQSVYDDVLAANGRSVTRSQIERSFGLLRAFGFKIHAHYMVNLLGSTPARDVEGFRELAFSPAFSPDEVKLYPCALIEGTGLVRAFEGGSWRPYGEDELVDVLARAVLACPPHLRISRMIRDFSSGDVLVGNKKTNLRQVVEERVARTGEPVHEMRSREIALAGVDLQALRLLDDCYPTRGSLEHFLQWVTPGYGLAAFLRLSLPRAGTVAMIREVHVYGKAARIGEERQPAQHHGLGSSLLERACTIAQEAGYDAVRVISAVGTRPWYRARGFVDDGLYQRRGLLP